MNPAGCPAAVCVFAPPAIQRELTLAERARLPADMRSLPDRPLICQACGCVYWRDRGGFAHIFGHLNEDFRPHRPLAGR